MRALILALVLSAGPALAQPAPPGAGPPGAGPPGAGPPHGAMLTRAQEVKREIRERLAYRLTNQLQLDETTAGRMFAVMARYDAELDRLLGQRADQQRQLKNAQQIRDPQALQHLIDAAVANQRALWNLEDRRFAELRKILTPQQTARLLVVLPALERRLQNQLQRAIAGAKKHHPNRRPARRGDDDDDDD